MIVYLHLFNPNNLFDFIIIMIIIYSFILHDFTLIIKSYLHKTILFNEFPFPHII